LLGQAFTFGSSALPAPQATLMKTVIEGVLSGSLPWGLVGTGAMLALCALLAGLPGLAFAVGIYLPLGSLTPIFLGGLVRRLVDARRGSSAGESDSGVLAASGMIAGEGLAGVAVALLVASSSSAWGSASGLADWLAGWRFAAHDFTWLSGATGVTGGVLLVALVAGLLWRAGATSPSRAPASQG
jgi:uncharacterized oligopeptide transporter (OPT) family protein